jgi:hypothetical protein
MVKSETRWGSPSKRRDTEIFSVSRLWGFGWMGRRLSEKDKFEITSWAFSYFMKSNLTVSDAVVEAVRKAKPDWANKDGSLKISKDDFLELQLRVKNML